MSDDNNFPGILFYKAYHATMQPDKTAHLSRSLHCSQTSPQQTTAVFHNTILIFFR